MYQIQKKANSVSHPPTVINIKIKTLNGTVSTITTYSNVSVSSIQGQIQQKTGVPVSMQRLLHKAVLLQPVKYLSDYGICDGHTIQLVANMLPQEISSPSISTHRQSEVAQTNALTQQNLKTKKHRYLQQRINGFSYKNNQSIQALKQNKTTIDKLLSSINHSKDGSTQPFMFEGRQLSVGDWVDVRDVSGLWVEGQVVSKKHNFVQIHCNGYPDRWNQWIQQQSQRIMPLRTQTVQLQDSPYFSPFPLNRPQIKSIKQPQQALQKLITQLPLTMKQITKLIQQLDINQQKSPQLLQHPKFKYSFNQQQQQQDLAQSFKNNRSHQSPPHSIHEQQYQYQQYEEYQRQIKNIPLINGIQSKQGESSSIKGIKGMIKMKIKNGRQLMRSNRYIETKKSYLGYSKTKSQHQHTLHHTNNSNNNRQQTPKKDTAMIDQLEVQTNNNNMNVVNSSSNVVVRKMGQIASEHGSGIDIQVKKQQRKEKQQRKQKQKQVKFQQKSQQKQQQIDIQQPYIYTPKGQSNAQYSSTNNANYIESNLLGGGSSANKHNNNNNNLQIDNISNKCQNISNKGQHDDGQSSAKSFGSKRSDRFPDASSMKSLNINLHNNDADIKNQKQMQNKKNIFVFDHSQAQSVKEVQNKDGLGKSNYYYNQEGILEEEDSQINQEANQEYFLQKKKQALRKLRATQLAPLCDRLGRMLVDLSPHLATLGYREYNASQLINQNLSTFTNQGSLHSRMKHFGQADEQEEEKSSHRSSKYWSFQIPVMLTPWQIIKLNKLLSEEGREHQ